MASTNLELSVDIACRLATMVNDEILKHGCTGYNNQRLWSGMLHRMDNTVWRGVLEMLVELNEQHPEMLDFNNLRQIQDALDTLNRYDMVYDRVLDIKNIKLDAKRKGWAALMSTREIINRCWGLDIPNADSSRVISKYGDLFE